MTSLSLGGYMSNQKYEPVIGLEMHVELNTKSKMFCRCSADYFGREPNTHTCPICLGLPGALPYINKVAIEDCIKIGLALNCTVSEKSLFERKNYFYPDLPKGYQISQYRWPLCVNGWIEVDDGDGNKRKIRINRAHQEEDTGKLTHSGGVTLIDFNRSGVPLVEIVTEPDFHDVDTVRNYAKKLQRLFRYLGVSNADMERGDMRLEPNLSLKKQGSSNLPNYKVEVKNINSFKFVERAIKYEIKRQAELLEKGKTPSQETRGFSEKTMSTISQRVKEEASDYRYFPEPDIPPFHWEKSYINLLRNSLPELPQQKRERFKKEYSIRDMDSEILTREKELADYFEKAIEDGKNFNISPNKIATYIINKKVDIKKILPTELIQQIIKASSVSDIEETELSKIIDETITSNPKAVEDYKTGKENAIMFLVGQVMRKFPQKVDASKIKASLLAKLR